MARSTNLEFQDRGYSVMKKFVITFCLIALGVLASCSLPPVPDPGFRVFAKFQESRGTFNVPISRPAYGSVTHGNWIQDLLGQQQMTAGEVRTFQKTADSVAAYFDVDGGRAPAVWFFDARAGWDRCTGQGIVREIQRGRSFELICTDRIGIIFPLAPSVIYSNQPPVELSATIQGANTVHGMPIIHFEDQTGKLVAKTFATEVNGYTTKFSSSCLIGKPLGKYVVKIYNVPPDSQKVSGQSLGTSSITYRTEPLNPCLPDGSNRPYCPNGDCPCP
jgi:hypothetical protein